GKSISNLSSTSRTPSFVTSAVVLPGTKSLWITKRSSVILIVLSFDGALPNCACRNATHIATAIAPASNRRAVDLFFMGESIYSGNVDQAHQASHSTAADARRRGRASAPRLRLRRSQRVRPVPPVRRLPQRQPGRIPRRFPLASASRHRDDHI